MTHSLYHAQLEQKCVPFLDEQPFFPVSLELYHVSRVMVSPVAARAQPGFQTGGRGPRSALLTTTAGTFC